MRELCTDCIGLCKVFFMQIKQLNIDRPQKRKKCYNLSKNIA